MPVTTDLQVEELDAAAQREAEAEERVRTMLPPSQAALVAVDLMKAYGRRRVVDAVSLHVEQGEVVGLLGANGAGKTTTFYMIVGLERPEAGQVRPGPRDITKMPMYLRARFGLGYLPQEPSVFS